MCNQSFVVLILCDQVLAGGSKIIGKMIKASYGASVKWTAIWKIWGYTRGRQEAKVAGSLEACIRESAKLDRMGEDGVVRSRNDVYGDRQDETQGKNDSEKKIQTFVGGARP